jgi:copper ion binding protein
MRTVLTVPDISCAHCVSTITAAVGEVPGVTTVDVQLDHKLVIVDGEFSGTAVAAAIVDAGYEVAGRG